MFQEAALVEDEEDMEKPGPPEKQVPKTTAWRHSKKAAEGRAPVAKKPRKAYTYSKCRQPMSLGGHSKYKGTRYCPAKKE